MNPIPKWALFLALGIIAVAAGYVIMASRVRMAAARVRMDMDKKATEVLAAQEKK